ncbi:Fungal specific transcription factor domain-containing protein [Cladophialophora immunda]|nr:Fungal specific transcription factor domain-containing protein [Cladophialophora immunda]
MASDSQPTEGFAYLQPLVTPEMPLSPDTTAATTVSNRPDIATKSSLFGMDLQPGSDNSLIKSRLWSQPVHETVSQDAIISVSMRDSDAMLHASHALNISPAVLERLIDAYFANMTAFSLFHRTTFPEKLKQMGPSLYLYALLASMCSFSARFVTDAEDQVGMNHFNQEPSKIPCAEHFHQVALRFEEESLTQCSDGTPPLEFLQAIILTTWFQLTKGVHGRAWRWLGTCIRVAYELNLHCIDAHKPEGYVPRTEAEILAWSQEEERRRCWWAVWEMDCFASTIRRVPTGLSWTQSSTLLPVEDQFWFRQNFHPSCFLPAKPGDRWQALQRSGNESPVAWIIVMISLSRNAQTLSLSEKTLSETLDKDDSTINHASEAWKTASNTEEELELLSHTLQCTLLALPDSLQYHNEALRFTSVDCDQSPVSSVLDHARYSIYVLTELTKFMIAHHYTFHKGAKPARPPHGNADMDIHEANSQPGILLMCTTRKPNVQGLKQYVEASNNIVFLLNRCSSTHVRYVNPFLATTIWLAATVQLLNKKFGPPPSGSRDLADAKFNALRLTYKQFVRFWNTPVGLLQILDSLEERFDRLLGSGSRSPVDAVNKSSNHGGVRDERRVFGFPETSIRFGDSSSTAQKRPSPPYTGGLTEPNLTGSGVNAMIASSVHSSQAAVDEQHKHILPSFGPSVMQFPQPGLSSENKTACQTGPVDTNVQFDHRTATDPMLDPMDFPLNFDCNNDDDLNLYLNNLLSGSYCGSLGPL